jgi:N-succinyldiaminopimelate aminotransferase
VNPTLSHLQPYPFEKLRALLDGVPAGDFPAIRLSVGEPEHPTPPFIHQALIAAREGLAHYPTSLGSPALRQAIADWLHTRYPTVPALNPDTEILPVAGTREALFSLAQAVIDRNKPGALVLCPNPGYQIYEGAALLAGATPYYVNSTQMRPTSTSNLSSTEGALDESPPSEAFYSDYAAIPDDIWAQTQLVYVCTPNNPTGAMLSLEDWRLLFTQSDRYGFVIASDECYSEIYMHEAHPPLGALEAAHQLGRGWERLVIFSSLSKRSNVPGLRSGFVAGDAAILRPFLQYRTYHGTALSPVVQAVSVAAWKDEAHVRENRARYREKFQAVTPLLAQVLDVQAPLASFYLWARIPEPICTALSDKAKTKGHSSDALFVRYLFADYNVTLLPGSYLSREVQGHNPGEGYLRIALVPSLADCIDSAQRIVAFCQNMR